ncbi:DNA mismatch repair protein MutH [Anaerosporobacter sp.]|uniref:DNA mismatch repair protein MutH n=1 Tax=Anaerosporobacter sp. TaxID=1872529 RepID=UPI00286F5ACC|nr:DNA mismatch repair protein MutH [Anaerosporobacter sp.]
MRLQEACERFNELAGIKFGELFSPSDMEMIIINKGKTGQLLELALGMHLSSTNLDFEDGELKTNKCDALGNPRETVFITQISSVIDELINQYPFERTHLYEKISNILYVPVCKDGDPRTWMFLPSINIDLNTDKFSELREIWSDDYYSICRQLKEHIETSKDGYIHTSNGTHIQVRSKDAKDSRDNYHPIYSDTYGRYVSNKNHAFYFQKKFVYDIKRINQS